MPASKFDSFRQQFPLISLYEQQKHQHNNAIIYFDNAASTQKPQQVINAETHFYQQANANVHRGSHYLSATATQQFEQAREVVRAFMNAESIKEIIWTKGTTEAINLIAHGVGERFLSAGDDIVLSYAEHHANIVPWQLVAEKTGANINVLPLTVAGIIDLNALDEIITSKTKIVCVSHIANVVGKVNPLEKIIAKAKQVNALTLIDGAQAIVHEAIDVQALDCDFYVFSGHKIYAPMGIGVLYGKAELLRQLPPYQSGGEMIKQVSFHGTSFNDIPYKFEAGTPNVAAAIALAEALSFVRQHAEFIAQQEQQLTTYFFKRLMAFDEIILLFKDMPDIPLFSFSLKDHHNHDVAASLDSYGIAVRSGHHCAMPLMAYKQVNGCIRVSLAAYNSCVEIDYFFHCLSKILHEHKQNKLSHNKNNNEGKTISETIYEGAVENIDASEAIIDLFSSLKGWDARHRQIMLLGKQLKRMDKNKRSDENLIHGCESLAWIEYQLDGQKLIFSADSDAKVIRGLLVIVLAAYDHKTAAQILAFNIDEYFNQLGLMQHLSPSRGNGVKAIVETIQSIARSMA